jgi:L-seryl-tRNA(Ser) seleniumtransferase
VEVPGRDSPIDAEALRQLPPVTAVLDREELDGLRAGRGRDALVRAVRAAIDEARRKVRGGAPAAVDAPSLAMRAGEILRGERRSLRPVINATGILLHTGLGRAPLAEDAVAAVAAVARGYCNLEFELQEGERGRRTAGIGRLLRELTGARAATVVNNNAAATVLALRALATGREVIVSRGQLVEIGGSFRLPEIFEVSGARLREVGTTNKTRLSDYERAIGPETAAILRVHHSNYRIVGFTEEAPVPDLARLAHARGLWMIDDVGSGALAPGQPPGIVDEPSVAEGLAAGADIVLFSGDKLLGGPQCGILVGDREPIARIESDPLMRALRVDKMTLAALEATLGLIRDGTHAAARLPLWRMIATPLTELEARADRLVGILRAELGLEASPITDESFIGGGSVPVRPILTAAVAISPPFPHPHGSEGAWARALRLGDPPVVPRVRGGSVLLDLRTVSEAEEGPLLDAIRRTCHDRGAAAAREVRDEPQSNTELATDAHR